MIFFSQSGPRDARPGTSKNFLWEGPHFYSCEPSVRFSVFYEQCFSQTRSYDIPSQHGKANCRFSRRNTMIMSRVNVESQESAVILIHFDRACLTFYCILASCQAYFLVASPVDLSNDKPSNM